jgi:NADPH:quinone reductase-like Zn-dependent oxidoreductase
LDVRKQIRDGETQSVFEKQCMGNMVFSWIKYPFVLGCDLAGEVVAVGSGVAEVKVGDCVLKLLCGSERTIFSVS